MVTTDLARRQTFLTARAWIDDFLASSDIVDYWGEENKREGGITTENIVSWHKYQQLYSHSSLNFSSKVVLVLLHFLLI